MDNICQYRGNQSKDIYVIRNRINDKLYVGQSKNAAKRFISHCKKSSAESGSLIGKAIQEYGANNFWYEILEKDVKNFDEREKYWIKELNTMAPHGYNVEAGGSLPPVYYSVNHPNAVFNNIDEADKVKFLLQNTRYPLSKIAGMCGISRWTVARINQGIIYEKAGETYPLRKIPLPKGKLSDEQVNEIIEILKHTYRQYEDIGEQYGVSKTTIKEINAGEIHYRKGEEYPIRKYKNSGVPACTYEEITEIHELIITTSISLNQLAKCYGIDTNTIYLINNGSSKRYRRDGYTYPLRPHNPKFKASQKLN